MELRIVGTEIELAEFLKALGTAKVIANAVIEKPKVLVDTKYLANKYSLTGQAIRNYAKKGMPHKIVDNGYQYDEADASEWIDNYISTHESKTRGKKYHSKGISVKPKKIKVVVNESDYTKWKASLMETCRMANMDFGKSLNLVYKYMTKNYGIVWEQEKKDFKADNGYYPKSTTQLAFWLEQTRPAYKNLVASCLDTIIKERR